MREGKSTHLPERPASRAIIIRVVSIRTSSSVRVSEREKGVMQKLYVIFGRRTFCSVDSASKGGRLAIISLDARRFMLRMRSVTR